ncbi:MAG: imidazole glycerol phosphate synthase subunit HisH [Methylohalobius sp.]|nr:imidazole glycerol phosphate synthase subunit HisH [Methylohalobius sp.]
MKVAVVDYGMGNLHSIAKALQYVAPQVQIAVTADPQAILAAERVVLPGVGAIADCIAALHRLHLVEVLGQVVRTRPLLGICLGLQALLEESEEGGTVPCLKFLPGRVVRFKRCFDAQGRPLKIPHMGWNRVHQLKPHPLWAAIPQGSWFYFVHSYVARPLLSEDVAATSDYPDPFACALARDNLFAVQFHPEKSGPLGLKLLSNFLSWSP